MEQRFKLSDKQFAALMQARQRLFAAKAQYDDALEKANTIGTLIADALGIPDDAQPELNAETQELVLKPAPKEPPPRRARKSASPSG